MAFEIVDGMTGTKHISSDDLSALNIATIGKANCVLEYGDDFKLTMASANSATIGTGVGMVGGKRFWNQAATSLTIQSGTQGQKRNDLVVARYAKTSAGIESITPVVVKGTPTTGNAADPAVTANDLKLWRVPLNGISVGTPVKLFEPMTPLSTVGDFISHRNTKNKTWAQNNWNISLAHMFGNLYYLQIQRTYNPFGGASGTEILTLDGIHLYDATQLALTGYVAAVAVIYGAARIDTNGKVTINAPSYGAPVTVLVSGYVVLN